MPVVKISNTHLAKLRAFAKANNVDLSTAFARAVEAAERASGAAVDPDADRARDRAEVGAKIEKLAEERGDSEEALDRLGPEADPETGEPPPTSSSSSSSEDDSDGTSTPEAATRSPLKRWARSSR